MDIAHVFCSRVRESNILKFPQRAQTIPKEKKQQPARQHSPNLWLTLVINLWNCFMNQMY